MAKMSYLDWRVCGIFAHDRARLIHDTVDNMLRMADIETVVYLRSRRNKTPPLYEPAFFLEDLSTRRTNDILRVAALASPRALFVFDDIGTVRIYPQSMTRNIIYHVSPFVQHKIVAGDALVTSYLYDLYSEFAILDKAILHANHYWCFKEDHREVSVFDGHTVINNKDPDYLAAKLRPFVYFDLEPQNAVQESLYRAMQTAPYLERVQDLSDLELK